MRKVFAFLITAIVLVSLSSQVLAVNPDEVLADPALEKRARELSVEIRCLVCQNQSIDDSDAQLAKDLRVLVREKLVEGFSDQEILDFLVKRYGEFVLLKPRFNAGTALLWVAPFAALVLAGILLVIRSRRTVSQQNNSQPLTAEEQEKLSKILQEEDISSNS
ncbi:MAG: cytochrome c-type biogenesis protein [Pseudomonadota bacterium]